MRLAPALRSVFAWYTIRSEFSFWMYSRLPDPSPSAKAATKRTSIVISAMTMLNRMKRPRVRQISFRAR